jgi:Resolvase, N terminal domain
MNQLLVGYARVSTEQQDLTAQRNSLAALGVGDDRIYVDHGLTGTNRTGPVCGSPWPPDTAATRPLTCSVRQTGRNRIIDMFIES